jgi:TPR repeat protein
VPVSSRETAGNILRRTGETLAEVATYAGHSTEMVFGAVRAKASAISFNKRALRKSTGAVIVLATMGLFLALRANFRNSFRSQRVDAATTSPTRRVSGHSQPGLATVKALPEDKPGATSHLEITDNSVKDSLRELTKYEIATLQRAADYGDDDAAFQLGMAYETGYYLRQNCSRAAHWVKVAAEAGNPAAAYNLGLRYRDGDGVPVDHSAAEHWLQIAINQKYSPAAGHWQSER